MSAPQTLYDKIWNDHVAHEAEDGTCLLYIDRHLVHEVTSPQAFEGLRMANRTVRAPEKTIAVPDHNVPTTLDRAKGIDNAESRIQVEALDKNAKDFGIYYYPVSDVRQGIVHIVGPEQGWTLPGMTVVVVIAIRQPMAHLAHWPMELELRRWNMFWPRRRSSRRNQKI